MVNIRDIVNNNIQIGVSYAYSDDFNATIQEIISMDYHEQSKYLAIQGVGVFKVNQNNVARQGDIPPALPNVLAALQTGDALQNSVVFYIATLTDLESPNSIKAMHTALKCFSNYVPEIINRRSASNLIESTENLGRAMGVEETTLESDQYHMQRLILISDSPIMPDSLNTIAYDVGNISVPAQHKDKVKVGMNSIQARYVDQLMEVANPSNSDRWKTISHVRKAVFPPNSVIQDITVPESPQNIGGYNNVKDYYKFVKEYINKEKSKKLKIKGSLFVGPAGTAKSKILTAIPSMLGLPGYFLNLNAAAGSLHGQTEQALRSAIETAKKYAPVVMCIDEIEKAVAGTGDGEVAGNEIAQKVLGILLTSMAEDTNIYWVASANKVSHLPAPLLRRGRWDYVWYVPIPDKKTMASIIGIHAKKYDLDINGINDAQFDKVFESMEGLVGAEIEHCIKAVSLRMIAGVIKKKDIANELIKERETIKNLVSSHKDSQEVQKWGKENAIIV